MARKMLLKNGTALIHDERDAIHPTPTDILIDGESIAEIGVGISEAVCEVIDCTNKIINTHHHVWQTPLRGRQANQTLVEYFASGTFAAYFFTPENTFWGELAGAVDMVFNGTTTVVDFANLNYSAEHNHNAISAIAASGIRSVFCYCTNARLASWEPMISDSVNALSGPVLQTFEEFAKTSSLADGRVTIGFAFDGFPFQPKDVLDMLMGKLRDLSIPLISFHYCKGPLMMGGQSIPQAIDRLGILDNRWLVAHSSNMTKEDGELYRKRGMHVSTTPSTEFQATGGFPVPAFNEELDIADICSFGVDCHTITSSFLPGEARLALQSARAARNQKFLDQGKMPSSVKFTVQSAFNQMTIQGARAAKMGDKIGSIAVGKRADLVIFDANSPSMVCGGVQDPVASIVLNSSPADVETVIIDGIVRKRGGVLKPLKLDMRGMAVTGKEMLNWTDIAKKLLETREELQRKMEKCDFKTAEKGAMRVYHINEADVVDHL